MLGNNKNTRKGLKLPNSFLSLLDVLKTVLSDCDDVESMDVVSLMAEAKRQALTGMVTEYIARHDARMTHEEKMRSLGLVLQVEKANRQMNRHVCDLAALLDSNGICYAVMKGQTVARFYPNPLLRMPGDIDVYVAERDFDKTCRLLESHGFTKIDFTMLHATYSKKGFPEVEVHFAVQKLQWSSHYRYLQRATRQMVDNAEAKYISIDGRKVAILPTELEVLLYTMHAFNHVFNGGVGLRQICDWMLCVGTVCNYIDIALLKKLLAGTGMTTMFRMLGYICSEYLGMSLDTPLWKGTGLHYSAKDIKTGRELMKWISVAGNFGKSLNLSRPQFYIRFLKNCWRFRRLDGKEVFIYPFMKIKRLIKGENHIRK